MRRVGLLAALLTLVLAGCQASGDKYGAIALSETTGRWGPAYDLATQASAEEAALRYCNTDDCRIVVWFANTCGAVARRPELVTWGLGETREVAEDAALAECGTDACEAVGWACTAR